MRVLLRSLVGLLVLGALALGASYLLRPAWLLDAELARQAWWAGVERRELEAAGHRWSYYDGGEGAPLLLVHGFAGSKENWLPLAARLSDRYRVIIPDLPGWGGSSRAADGDYGIEAQALRLGAFIDALGAAPVHLVGHSMGGHIAGVHAARDPSRLATLTLLDSAGVRFTENDFARRVLGGATPFNFASVAELDQFFAELFAQPPWLPSRLKQVLVERSVPNHAFQRALLDRIGRGPEALLLESQLAAIRLPTLVVWCRDDALLDVSAVDVLRAGLPQAQAEILDGCSHLPMLEVPADLATRLDAFLGAQRSATR